jgi:hypothetical protein
MDPDWFASLDPDPYPHWRQSFYRIRVRMDPDWFGSLDPDPYPQWGEKLAPDLDAPSKPVLIRNTACNTAMQSEILGLMNSSDSQASSTSIRQWYPLKSWMLDCAAGYLVRKKVKNVQTNTWHLTPLFENFVHVYCTLSPVSLWIEVPVRNGEAAGRGPRLSKKAKAFGDKLRELRKREEKEEAAAAVTAGKAQLRTSSTESRGTVKQRSASFRLDSDRISFPDPHQNWDAEGTYC